jgi:hypothetical protein
MKDSSIKSNPDDINFPVFDEKMEDRSPRSLDEVDQWIEHDYMLFFDRIHYKKDKVRLSVYNKFSI